MNSLERPGVAVRKPQLTSGGRRLIHLRCGEVVQRTADTELGIRNQLVEQGEPLRHLGIDRVMVRSGRQEPDTSAPARREHLLQSPPPPLDLPSIGRQRSSNLAAPGTEEAEKSLRDVRANPPAQILLLA